MGVEGVLQGVSAFGYGFFAIDSTYIKVYSTLPLLHRDPFDGIIIATAIVENMTIPTADENVQKYDVLWVW